MVGLVVCSVWVWAIAIDKTLLFSRIRNAGDNFEQAFWSGQSLEELYKSLAASPAIRPGRFSSPPCTNGSEASKAMPARSPVCRCASRR